VECIQLVLTIVFRLKEPLIERRDRRSELMARARMSSSTSFYESGRLLFTLTTEPIELGMRERPCGAVRAEQCNAHRLGGTLLDSLRARIAVKGNNWCQFIFFRI
jgi:hypothetical protein